MRLAGILVLMFSGLATAQIQVFHQTSGAIAAYRDTVVGQHLSQSARTRGAPAQFPESAHFTVQCYLLRANRIASLTPLVRNLQEVAPLRQNIKTISPQQRRKEIRYIHHIYGLIWKNRQYLNN